ncbi:MAG: hypothetical protein ABIB71_06355 [Candidatus Woesearchaeota archaeon]
MKKIAVIFALLLLLAGSAMAAELSIQLKRTNPGIAGERSAEFIFSVANMDTTQKIQGFLLCRSPDDATVGSSLGAGVGSGAQYLSPMFTMDKGPAEESMALTLNAVSAGDKRADCTIKYIPYKEEASAGEEVEIPIDFSGQISTLGTDVGGFIVTLVEYTPEVEAVNATEEAVNATEETEAIEAQPATAKIDVDGTFGTLEVGEKKKIGALEITLDAAEAESATIKAAGKKVTTAEGVTVKKYQKMNGEYVIEDSDENYRQLRLDKVVPFAEPEVKDAKCPEGNPMCTSADMITVGGKSYKVWWILGGVLLLVIVLVIYLLGKTSRS